MKKIVFALVIFSLIGTPAFAAVLTSPTVPAATAVSICYPYTAGEFYKIDEKTLPSGITLQNNGASKVQVTNTTNKNFEIDDVRLVSKKRYNRDANNKWKLSDEPYYLMFNDGKTAAEKSFLLKPTQDIKPVESSIKAKYGSRTVEIKGRVSYFLKENEHCFSSGKPYGPINPLSFNADLDLGSTGDDVIKLQTYLIEEGHLSIPPTVTKGYFGQLTRNALVTLQKKLGITPTGVLDSQTRALISSPLAP